MFHEPFESLYFYQSALHVAVITGSRPVVDCLVCAGASPDLQDRNGNSCVHLAVRYAAPDCLTALLKAKKKPDLDLRNYEGERNSYIFLSFIFCLWFASA